LFSDEGTTDVSPSGWASEMTKFDEAAGSL
jgi:hypothetical protein